MKILVAVAACVIAGGWQAALAQPPSTASSFENGPDRSLDADQLSITQEGEGAEQSVARAAEDVLDLAELAELRGGETVGIQYTSQNLSALNSGNSVSAGTSVGSGTVNLNPGAFDGYNGIGNFVINTGHNNNLIGSVSVNVMVTPQ
ncbi:MAG: hypothetical protein EON93_03045 [Burkholderiales bacterium]|nr:MAG: hypothetical protein EON93_03045 [Burkholderiales bacterium]